MDQILELVYNLVLNLVVVQLVQILELVQKVYSLAPVLKVEYRLAHNQVLDPMAYSWEKEQKDQTLEQDPMVCNLVHQFLAQVPMAVDLLVQILVLDPMVYS